MHLGPMSLCRTFVYVVIKSSQPSFINSLSGHINLDTTISIDDHVRQIRPYTIAIIANSNTFVLT